MVRSRNVIAGFLMALSTSAAAFAQTSPRCTAEAQSGRCADPVEAAQLAKQYVTERLAVWQQRLKLDAWKISVSTAHRTELKPKTLGAIRWDKTKKTAVIWVLDSSDYNLPFRDMLNDMELTIVHELVHLELASLPRSQASRSTEEHAVNGIADALLDLDRRKQ